MAKRNAFTLAEVLITLGIIGVVAAMTLPTLLNSTQLAQFRSQAKKTLSVGTQAITVTLAMDDYDASQAKNTSGEQSLHDMFSKHLQLQGEGASSGPYKNSWSVTKGDSSSAPNIVDSNYTFYLNDGSALSFPKTSTMCTKTVPCKGLIDVNAHKNPNMEVKCDDGTSGSTCKVTKAYDVYPIKIQDQEIVPASDAAREILFGGKK